MNTPHPLDRVISEQAAYYGQTVEQFGRMTERWANMVEQAEIDDHIELGKVN